MRSINVVKHSSDKAAKSEGRVAINDLGSNGASLDFTICVNSIPKSSLSEKAAYLAADSVATSAVECGNDINEIHPNISDGGRSADIDKLADQFSEAKSCQGEEVGSDAIIEDMENRSKSDVISQDCLDHHNTSKDQAELLDSMVADDIRKNVENTLVANDIIVASSDLNARLGPETDGAKEVRSNEDLGGPNESLGTELGAPYEMKSNENDVSDQVLEPGCIFVEFRRTEACCKAAHCLHGRFFDGRLVTVEYVAPSLYKAWFTK